MGVGETKCQQSQISQRAGPMDRGRGHGRAWDGRWGVYKGPQRPPASRIPSPAARTRAPSHISAFPTRFTPTPTPREGWGQGYCVPTLMFITPRARIESQRGEIRKVRAG